MQPIYCITSFWCSYFCHHSEQKLCRNQVCQVINLRGLCLWFLPSGTHTHLYWQTCKHTNIYIFFSPYQMDCSLKPSQRTDMHGRRNKGKRGPEENGGGPLSEPEEGAPHSYSSSCWKPSRNKRRRIEVNT